jgi:Ran GTPase-activating protein (RanGAP) involved in mRNA processing and transport
MREVVSQVYQSIKVLDLSGCFQVDDSVLSDIVSRCTNLTHLNIENCKKIGDKSIDALVNCKLSLDALNIGGNYNISGASLKKLVINFPCMRNLRELNISGLEINDELIYRLIESCTSIESLGISFADISEVALNSLLDKFGFVYRVASQFYPFFC